MYLNVLGYIYQYQIFFIFLKGFLSYKLKLFILHLNQNSKIYLFKLKHTYQHQFPKQFMGCLIAFRHKLSDIYLIMQLV